MVRIMSDDVCKCGHSKDDHVTVHIKPGGMNGETTGHLLKCAQCLCQDFEPEETETEE
jgi:hypothetical protein